MSRPIKNAAKAILPSKVYQPVAARWRSLRWTKLRRVTPLSRKFGTERGKPIDRYYIESFLIKHQSDVRGRVLEIGDPRYTQEFGGERVTTSDVLHAVSGNPLATIVADLADAPHILDKSFDCIIFTQVLQFIYDFRPVIHTLHRILDTNGVLLATFPGISQISRSDAKRWGDFWRFTSMSTQRLFATIFSAEGVTVETFGNVLSASAFLYGLTCQELLMDELNHWDEDYEVTVGVRAVRMS
jgi:hypothetical protein